MPEATQTPLSAAAARSLIEAGILAPSGDNVQPWAFDVDSAAGRVTIRVDPDRDRSPMNAGQRMSRIAVGAAAENVLRTAAFNHLSAIIENVSPEGVSLRIEGADDGALTIDEPLRRRCTNRRRYDERPVPRDSLDALQHATADLNGVRTLWVTDRKSIQQIAAIVRRADAVLFSHPAMRRAFFENVRFDVPDHEPVAEGLPLTALEITGPARTAFRLLPRLPDWAASVLQVGASIGRQTEKLVTSASGLCVGIAADETPERDFTVGRAMQRAWLALTEQRLAVQPMMSLAVLLNAALNGTDDIKQSLPTEQVRKLADEFREIIHAGADGRLAFLLRFGFADEPTGRAGRLPVSAEHRP